MPCLVEAILRAGLRFRRAGVLGGCLLLPGPLAFAQSAGGRGPSEIRDEQVLAQPRLTLPALAPETVPAGSLRFAVASLWSSTFAWDQDRPGETPGRRTFLLDAETLTLDAQMRYGLRPRWDVGLRLPLRWRGGGVMDPLIDAWHKALSLPTGNRPDFLQDAFRVEGRRRDGGSFRWNDRRGIGLGNAELETRWRVVEGSNGAGSIAVVGRLALPTGTGAFAGNSAGIGAQLVAHAPLADRVDLYGGIGGTLQGHGPVEGVEYERTRAHGFVAFEWRPWRSLSLVAETNLASRLVSSIDHYPGTHWMLDVSARHPLRQHAEIELGFTENFASQLSTTDFALFAGFSLRR